MEDLDSLVVVEPDLFDESNLEDASTLIADSASIEVTTVENTDDQSTINRYCKCTSYECNCCREFRLPIAGIGSNGCATVNYLNGERMSVGLKFGDRLVASRVISSKYLLNQGQGCGQISTIYVFMYIKSVCLKRKLSRNFVIYFF